MIVPTANVNDAFVSDRVATFAAVAAAVGQVPYRTILPELLYEKPSTVAVLGRNAAFSLLHR